MSAIRHGLAQAPWMFALACGSDAPSQELGADNAAARAVTEDNREDASIERDSARNTSADASSAQDASAPDARDGSGDAELADPCRVACIDGSTTCTPAPTFAPTLEETLVAWKAKFCSAPRSAFVGESRCAGGTRLLSVNTGAYSERRYFAADGKFLSVQAGSDAPPLEIAEQLRMCDDGTYWPVRATCTDPELVRNHCEPPP